MAYPEFDGFSLQDSNYITGEINYRSLPNRSMNTEKIARRPGVKLLATDYAERIVRLVGHIVGDDSDDLQSKIDDLHSNVNRKDEGTLYISAERYATATTDSLTVGDPHYAQDFVPFEVEFLLADPFYYGVSQTASWTVTSGITTETKTITISGTAFAVPSIIYNAPSGLGQTTTSGISVEYDPTSETVTWSGTGATTTLAYGSTVTFNYADHLILEDTTEVDVEGVFARMDPGSRDIVVTYSGTALGGSVDFTYSPRYL